MTNPTSSTNVNANAVLSKGQQAVLSELKRTPGTIARVYLGGAAMPGHYRGPSGHEYGSVLNSTVLSLRTRGLIVKDEERSTLMWEAYRLA